MSGFSEQLKELRDEKGISQSKLAKEIGVTQKAIDFWEKAINEPKASYIIELCKFFEVSSDFLLGLDNYYYCETKKNEAS